jgi:hypothetical protein
MQTTVNNDTHVDDMGGCASANNTQTAQKGATSDIEQNDDVQQHLRRKVAKAWSYSSSYLKALPFPHKPLLSRGRFFSRLTIQVKWDWPDICKMLVYWVAELNMTPQIILHLKIEKLVQQI